MPARARIETWIIRRNREVDGVVATNRVRLLHCSSQRTLRTGSSRITVTIPIARIRIVCVARRIDDECDRCAWSLAFESADVSAVARVGFVWIVDHSWEAAAA